MHAEGALALEKAKVVNDMIKSMNHPVVLRDEKGQSVGFRTVSATAKAVRERFGNTDI